MTEQGHETDSLLFSLSFSLLKGPHPSSVAGESALQSSGTPRK